ncbi:MAG: phosphatidate cytidylyltransferase [Bacteroidales bacterium]|nr:phosphatidate cytidylyltransferase [Bacteroidales bacterium]
MSELVKRTLSGAIFLAVMVAGMLFHPAAFGILFLFVMYFAMREFMHITMGSEWLLQQRLAVIAACLAFIGISGMLFFGLDARWTLLALVPFFAIPLSVIFAKNHERVETVALVYVALIYVGLPFCLAQFIVYGPSGEFEGLKLLNVFIIIWCSDVGAYSLGTLLGQRPNSRKLAPAISPKKSYWGLWGGILCAVLASWILFKVGWLPYDLIHCIALGVVIPVAGVCGDLFESVWKRRFGFKDSGNMIPGHGGMLDRFDSSLFAIPAVFVYLFLFGLL